MIECHCSFIHAYGNPDGNQLKFNITATWYTEVLLLGGNHHNPNSAKASQRNCHGTQHRTRVHVPGDVSVIMTSTRRVDIDASSTLTDP